MKRLSFIGRLRYVYIHLFLTNAYADADADIKVQRCREYLMRYEIIVPEDSVKVSTEVKKVINYNTHISDIYTRKWVFRKE